MHQLVYLSKATERCSEEELAALCRRSAAHNRALGVTGLLLYDGARFIQALEGEEAAVRAIMARIAADRRHTDIDYVSDKAVEERQFGSWSMDYQSAPSGCCSREFLDRVKADVEEVADMSLRAAFIGFAVLGRDRPAGYRCVAA